MNNRSSHRNSRSNRGILLFDTVQTSWRPQLPLPKEVANFEHNNPSSQSLSAVAMERNAKQNASKKWSFGRFFRKKKDIETESSTDEDRKAGFVPALKPRKKEPKRKQHQRGSKVAGAGFDHIVVNPKDNHSEVYLQFEGIETPESIRSAAGSLDRRLPKGRKQTVKLSHCGSSSEEEIKSHNSSSISRYRSDESLGSGGAANNRRSRAARTERYYKRIGRDDSNNPTVVEVHHHNHHNHRWKTQPIDNRASHLNYGSQQLQPTYGLKSSASLTSVPAANSSSAQNWGYPARHCQQHRYNSQVNPEKRSVSFENNMQFQTRHPKEVRSPPPAPPPRDPQRRLQVTGHGEVRPISYAFDKSPAPIYTMNGRCVSDDRLWGQNGILYPPNQTIPRPASTQPMPQPRRFITRADRDPARNQTISTPQDYRYIADSVPRSRKPIHIIKSEEPNPLKEPQTVFLPTSEVIRTNKNGLPSPMQTASNFWKKIEQEQSVRRGRTTEIEHDKPKTRSVSTSRLGESRPFRSAFESLFQTPKSPPRSESVDVVDSGAPGNLVKVAKNAQHGNMMEVSIKPLVNSKTSSMPNYYKHQIEANTGRKYDHHILNRAAEERKKIPPVPPQRNIYKASPDKDVNDQRKSTNLEDAINELEQIYKSLKLGDEDLLDRADRRDIPTPTNFGKCATTGANDSEYSDDNDDLHETGEPDVLLDDVVYRNLKRANTMLKTVQTPPPFGIPIGPVPPSPNTDYLHVTPEKKATKKNRAVHQIIPDLVTDDLAVRALRKDPPNSQKSTFVYPNSALKKKRAVRSMSANIYNLIQRDAAKPSGGDLYDYSDLDKTLEKAGSMSEINTNNDNDVPATLTLLRNLRNQEKNESSRLTPIFRHPSKGGAVFNLPSTLKSSPKDSKAGSNTLQKPPMPLPRKSLSPEPVQHDRSMEDFLNQIAIEAKQSSEKLSRDLMELRKNSLKKKESPRDEISNKSENKRLNKNIDEASKRRKNCGKIPLNVIPSESETQPTDDYKPRKLEKEELLNDIDEVSEAAKVCEKILQDAVCTEPPAVIAVAEVIHSTPICKKSSEMIGESKKNGDAIVASIIKKLDPNSQKIGEIAARCMRQISELSNLQDEQLESSSSSEEEENDLKGVSAQYEGPDYDNLNPELSTGFCNTSEVNLETAAACLSQTHSDSVCVTGQKPLLPTDNDEEEIDKIMKECEKNLKRDPKRQSSDEQRTSDEAKTPFSSSDCLKSSSPTASRHKSSSLTSVHGFSSSDFVKSTSSDFNPSSTDQIKTFSTTSYDVASTTSATPNNITNSPFSTTPSPILISNPARSVVVVRQQNGKELDSNRSQYNSSEELAMIFGIANPQVGNSGTGSTNTATTTTTTGEQQRKLATVIESDAICHGSNVQNNNANHATNAVVVDSSNISKSKSIASPLVIEEIDETEICCYDHLLPTHDSSASNYFSFSPAFRQIIAPALCLETIPELHDDETNENEQDNKIYNNPNSHDKISLFSFNNNIQILLNDQKLNALEAQALDSITLTNSASENSDTESNPDSGNVSLSDFASENMRQEPIMQTCVINQSKSTELNFQQLNSPSVVNSEEINDSTTNPYPFISQIDIQTNDSTLDLTKILTEKGDGERMTQEHKTSENCEDLSDESSHETEETENNSNLLESKLPKSKSSATHNIDKEAKFRNIRPCSSEDRTDFGSATTSSSCSSSSSKLLSTSDSRRETLINHVILVCTCSLASNDFYTFLAIIVAIITLIAFILL